MDAHFHLSVVLSFSIIFLQVFSLVAAGPSQSPAKSSDLEKLLRFKASLPERSVLPNWLPGGDPCTFYGVQCLIEKSTVSSIDLSTVSLRAGFQHVAAFLMTLENLRNLSLSLTQLSGPIVFPSGSICSPVLAYLDLSRNALSGSLAEIANFGACSSLTALNLSSNELSSSAKALPPMGLNLESLDLSSNFIGEVDALLPILSDGCRRLQYLSLHGNKANGVMDFSACGSLVHLDISSNNFSAAVPALGNCSALSYLDISANKFFANLEEAVGRCEKLSFLNASNNGFANAVPMLPVRSLQVLALSGNLYHGEFPSQILGACPGLVLLDLSYNNFSGMLPSGLGSCSKLQSFSISSNNFSGELSAEIFLGMNSLKVLDLSFNGFNGVLSDDFNKLASLETLDMSSNRLYGNVPSGLCQGPGFTLKKLYLQNNLFAGSIPPSLGNCSQLKSLHMGYNLLSGSIPATLGLLSELQDLTLLFNELTGEIPVELMKLKKLETLILDFNYLTGSIPSSISNFDNLNWLSLSNNELSGELPASLGKLTNLAILKLSNNTLSGRLPPDLGDCRSLIWLDLNSNHLNGSIPGNLFKQSGNIAVNFIRGKKYVYLKNDVSDTCHGTGNLLDFVGIRPDSLLALSSRIPCHYLRVYEGNTQPTFDNNGSMIFLDLSYNDFSGVIPPEIGTASHLFILNLRHNNLSGRIPNEIGLMKSLSILDLSYNHFDGRIPQSMSRLSLLVELNLTYNQLTGQIPFGGQFSTFPPKTFANNSDLCGIPLPSCDEDSNSTANSDNHGNRRRQVSVVKSVAMGLLFALFCVVAMIIVALEKKKRMKLKESSLDAFIESNSHSGMDTTGWKITTREALSISLVAFEKPLRKLNFADLLEATNGFSNDSLIGSGGFGDVYRARLKDGIVVAIKKLKQVSGQGDREFTAEMETIGKIKHRNLVPLLGYCKVGDERLLVYEYMKYGSLEDVLHDQKKLGMKLGWASRRKIALGAARGLAFLHHNCIPHIIHRDLKSSNVLLDENFEARVSDFGMARLMSAMDTHLSVSTLAGTPGYVPPEYYQSFRCSTRGDVYSYGVVLLELLTGKRPTDSADFGDNNLVGWVKMHANLKISDVFDPCLMMEDPTLEVEELLHHLKVACACLDDRPWRRPTMIQVMAMFKEIQAGSGFDSHQSIPSEDSTLGSINMLEMSIKEGPEPIINK